jgi:hypothetical protein
MTTKNEMLKCDLTADTVTFIHMVRNENGDFVEGPTKPLVFDCNDVEDTLVNGEGFASMKAYGLRAFVCDRSSDFRKHGIAAYMDAMQDVFDTTLAKGLFKAKKATKVGAIDPLLIAAIAELKSIELAQAEKSLKALSKEQRDSIAANAKVKELMAVLASEKASAEAVDLDDLL